MNQDLSINIKLPFINFMKKYCKGSYQNYYHYQEEIKNKTLLVKLCNNERLKRFIFITISFQEIVQTGI